jgi:hypothetical protein
MIFEMRTYTLKSRSMAEVEARFQNALVERVRLSPLGAFWRTEVGVLNRFIVVWPYASVAERERIREQAAGIAGWPPDIGEFVIEQDSRIFNQAPFSPPFEPRQLGKLYEIRTYTYPTSSIPEVIQTWSELIEARVQYSPLVAAGYSEQGPFSLWVHIWAYQNAAERERIRDATVKAGIWPISVVDQRLKRTPRAVSIRMENMLVVPAVFSPLR